MNQPTALTILYNDVVACRLCPRLDCSQRAVPPLHHQLALRA